VVSNNHAHAQFFGSLHLLQGPDAAVDRDEQLGAFGRKEVNGIQVEPVAFVKAIRDIDPRFVTKLAEEFEQQGRRSDTVGIVITIDGNIFATLQSLFNYCDRVTHAKHQEGLSWGGRFGAQVGLSNLSRGDAAVKEQLPQEGRIISEGMFDVIREEGRDDPAFFQSVLFGCCHRLIVP